MKTRLLAAGASAATRGAHPFLIGLSVSVAADGGGSSNRSA